MPISTIILTLEESNHLTTAMPLLYIPHDADTLLHLPKKYYNIFIDDDDAFFENYKNTTFLTRHEVLTISMEQFVGCFYLATHREET